MRDSKGTSVVLAAIFANAGIAAAKFIVAAISGSSAILSEGIHSTVDTLNECLLLVGLGRSRLSAEDAHQCHRQALHISLCPRMSGEDLETMAAVASAGRGKS